MCINGHPNSLLVCFALYGRTLQCTVIVYSVSKTPNGTLDTTALYQDSTGEVHGMDVFPVVINYHPTVTHMLLASHRWSDGMRLINSNTGKYTISICGSRLINVVKGRSGSESGKHRMIKCSTGHPAEFFSKTLEMVPNGLNIYQCMSHSTILAIIFPVTTFSGKYGIKDGTPQNYFKIYL